jgi:5-(carboxyamino)imidazole ribonucleotide synthase
MKNGQPFEEVIGIIGGGQLGKMLIESCQPWNLNYHILEASSGAPAVRYAHRFVEGSLHDSDAIKELAQTCDVLTFEIEHIDVQTLKYLEQQGKRVIPSSNLLEIIQDKGVQKRFYRNHNIPTSPFEIVESAQVKEAVDRLDGAKAVVKSCKGGYDGKGVFIADKKDFQLNQMPFDGPCVVEQFAAGSKEVSVLVARNASGDMKTYPLSEMVFDPELNLVDYLFAPGTVRASFAKQIEQVAIQTIESMKGVGIFAVEFFVSEELDRIWVNEVAPRPHNSGHHTIEACVCSQYEQLNRILLNLPLGDTALRKPAVMMNLIGPEGVTGKYRIEGLAEALRDVDVHFHWYDKEVTKPGRKMGHITVLAETVDLALKKAKQMRDRINIVAYEA